LRHWGRTAVEILSGSIGQEKGRKRFLHRGHGLEKGGMFRARGVRRQGIPPRSDFGPCWVQNLSHRGTDFTMVLQKKTEACLVKKGLRKKSQGTKQKTRQETQKTTEGRKDGVRGERC